MYINVNANTNMNTNMKMKMTTTVADKNASKIVNKLVRSVSAAYPLYRTKTQSQFKK